MHFGIWPFAVAPSDAAEKNRNISAQPQSLKKVPKIFWKIYFLCDSWCAQTCSFRTVFGLAYYTNFDNCCQRYIATCGKKFLFFIFFYIVHIILSPKLLQWNFSNPQPYTRSGAHKLFRRFLDFSQFLTAISRKMWRHLATEIRTV